MPDKCAPTTAIAISSPLATAGTGASAGCGTDRAPTLSWVSAWNTRPMLASMASLPAGASSVMPNGMPSGRIAAGSARPQRSSKLTKLV